MNKVKGIWIRRKGCMWDAEVTEMSFAGFAQKLHKFAEEEGGFATPYIITRNVGGHQVDIWYDENFLSYQPAPSGVCTKPEGVEVLMGMLFITGGDDDTGESVSLPDDVIEDVMTQYRAPTMKTAGIYGAYGMLMLGFKLLHYEI